MVHSEVYLNKYAVSIAPSSLLFCMFSLFNFSSIFQGVSWPPFAPMCGRPCPVSQQYLAAVVDTGLRHVGYASTSKTCVQGGGGQSTGSARRRILLRFSSTWDVWIEHSKHITSNSGRRPNRNECKLSVWINGLVTYSTSVLPCVLIRHGTGSLGHPVNGSFGSSFTSGSPGHHFDPVWDPSFSGYRKKMPKMQNVHLKCWNDKSHCQVSVVGLKSLDVSPCSKKTTEQK